MSEPRLWGEPRLWLEDLWYGLRYRSGFEKNRRSRWAYQLRVSRCAAGIHWPITFQYDYYGHTPPEPEWACDCCGHKRLPYRAFLWTPRWWIPTFVVRWFA